MAADRDVIELLTEDHERLRALIARLDRVDDPAEMRRVYLQIVELLSAHETAEEAVVFPALQAAVPASAADAVARVGEHEEIDQLLDEMRTLPPWGHGFAKRACALVLELEAHLDEEDAGLFIALHDALPPQQLVELGSAFAIAKQRAAAFHAAV